MDFNIAGTINDPDNVTRVKCSNGLILNIGKVIRDFNAIDTGVFLCTPVIFDALESSQAAGDESISGGSTWTGNRLNKFKPRWASSKRSSN